jgi:hypothetical protein
MIKSCHSHGESHQQVSDSEIVPVWSGRETRVPRRSNGRGLHDLRQRAGRVEASSRARQLRTRPRPGGQPQARHLRLLSQRAERRLQALPETK